MRYITIGSQQTEKSETDGHHDPPNVIDGTILLGHFNNDTTIKGEGGDHESSREEVNTRPDGRSSQNGLEIDRKVVCETR